EVDAEVGLSESIEVWYKSMGKSMQLRVEYPWKLTVCSHYNGDGGWKSVKNRRYERNEGVNGGMYRQRNNYGEGSSSIGGFGGRGRGVKRNGVPGPVNAKETDGNRKGKSKVDEGGSFKDSVGMTEIDCETTNVGGRNVNKGDGNNGDGKNVNASRGGSNDNVMNGFSYQNMFSVLSDEAEIERRLEWESMKERIDEACEKGLRISVEEKSEWPEDLWVYFKGKMHELIRKDNAADLKVKIKNLENHISYSSRMIAKESKTKTEEMVKSVMIENGLTEK
ncbi:hypothetical protein Tco_0611130, partial [Tanacetum coccineum]